MEPWIKESDITNGLVSVIIPTYNRSELLREAIQSTIAQTYRPIECIVVDDGSSDNTKEVVDGLIIKNNQNFKLIYIHQQNAGSQVARNTGTMASTGEYIQYLDSDDLLYPEKIEKQVSFLNMHTDCDGVWSSWRMGTPEKNVYIGSIAREDLLTQFLSEHCIHTLAFLLRRKLVEKIGPWDVDIKRNQEIDFQVRGLLAGANYQYQSQIGGLWRIHEGDRIANTTGTKDFLQFYKKWEILLTEKGLFNEQIKRNFSIIYFWRAINKSRENQEALVLFEEAIRLNPRIDIVQTWKMRTLKRLIGERNTLKLWLLIFNKKEKHY